jgi:dienelactone hydrolase
LTKRGFFIAALDYQGQAESGGDISNMNHRESIPALAQDCSKLLDKLEILPFYQGVNESQIGLIGHSLGGMVVLMNQALDPRFKVTVAWAPLVDPEVLNIDIAYEGNSYYPINLLNERNTENLLIIMHVNDEALDFTKHALKAQELTDCTVIPHTESMIGGGHALFSDAVLIESIEWFEIHFFNKINGPIQITYILNYILIFICIGLFFATFLSLVSNAAKYFLKNQEKRRIEIVKESVWVPFSVKLKQFAKVIFYATIFLLNLIVFEQIIGIVGIIVASLNIILLYFAVKLVIYYKTPKFMRARFDVKYYLKSHLYFKSLALVGICTYYFLAVYLIFSYSYPFGFMWPSSIEHFVLAFMVFPVYLSIEILLIKLVYPKLFFLDSETLKTMIILGLAFLIEFFLIQLTGNFSFFPSMFFTHLIFTIVIVQNTILYKRVKSFGVLVLIPFEIVQVFFAAVISNALGIGIALNILINI